MEILLIVGVLALIAIVGLNIFLTLAVLGAIDKLDKNVMYFTLKNYDKPRNGPNDTMTFSTE